RRFSWGRVHRAPRMYSRLRRRSRARCDSAHCGGAPVRLVSAATTGTAASPDREVLDRGAAWRPWSVPMTAPLVAPSIRKIFALTLALGIASAATLLIAPPAEAKRMTCLQKYHGCQIRCLRSGDLASNGWY